MGGDGGATMDRRDCIHMVKLKVTPESVGQVELGRLRWSTCHLSEEPLREPVVACELGRLYNKEAVVGRLLKKDKRGIEHIRGLRDLTELILTPNPQCESVATSTLSSGDLLERWVCPVMGLPTDGVHRFVFFRACCEPAEGSTLRRGHVVAKHALKELGADNCPACSEEGRKTETVFSVDVEEWEPSREEGKAVAIPLAPLSEVAERLAKQMTARREVEPKGKKRKAEGQEPVGMRRAGPAAPGRPAARRAPEPAVVSSLKRMRPDLGARLTEVQMPPGADPKVWEEMFRKKQGLELEDPMSFMTRAGMRGGGGGRM